MPKTKTIKEQNRGANKINWLLGEDLIPYARNARTHTEEQVTKLAASIREFGFNNPVLVDPDSTIIAGHGRVLAAKKLGMDKVPVISLSHLTEAQKKAFIIADNRMALDAGWDEEMLSLELKELDEEFEFDLSLTGMDAKELELALSDELDEEPPEAKMDKADELQEKWNVERGQLWEIGNHRLYCGDATSKEDVERLMGGDKVGVVYADPPYGMGLDTDYSNIKGSSKAKITGGGRKYSRVLGDNEDFHDGLILSVFAFFNKVPDIFLWGADYYAELIPKRKEGSWVVWDKRGSEEADAIVGSSFELCWSKQKHKRLIARVSWIGAFGEKDARNRKHPTQKPERLARWFLSQWGSGIIIDPFLGSGTSLSGNVTEWR